MPIEVADLVATIRADLSGLTAGLSTAQSQMQSFAKVGSDAVEREAARIRQIQQTSGEMESRRQAKMASDAEKAAKAAGDAIEREASRIRKLQQTSGEMESRRIAQAAAAAEREAVKLSSAQQREASKAASAMSSANAKAAKDSSAAWDSFFTGLKVAVGVATAVAGALGTLAYGLFEITKNANEATGKLYDLAVKTGVAVPVLSALKFGAEESGISLQRVGVAITQFEKKLLSAAEGSKTAQADLARFNLTSEDIASGLNGNVTPALEKALNSIGKMPAGAAKAAAEMKLFGRTGADIGVIMQNLGGDLDDSIAKLTMFGQIISQESAAKAKEFNNALFTLEAEISAIGRTIAEEVGPAIIKAIAALTDWFVRNQDTIRNWAVALGEYTQSALFISIKVFTEMRKGLAILGVAFETLIEAGSAFSEFAGSVVMGGTAILHTFSAIAFAAAGDFKDAFNEVGVASDLVSAGIDRVHLALSKVGAAYQGASNDARAYMKTIDDDETRANAFAAGILNTSFLNAPAGGGEGPDLQGKTAKAKKTPNDGSDALTRAQESLSRTLADMKLKAFKSELEDERSELEKSFADLTIDYRQYYDGLTVLANKQFNEERSDQADAINQMLMDRQKLAARAANATTSKDANAANEAIVKIDEQVAKALGKLDDAYSSNEKEVTKWSKALTAAQKEMIKGSNEAAVALMEAMGGDSAFQGQRDALVNAFTELEEKLQAAVKNADPAAIAWLKSAEAVVKLKIATTDVNQALQAYNNVQATTAANEEAIRRQISLGQISDADATKAIVEGRQQQEQALQALIDKEQEEYDLSVQKDPAKLNAIKAQVNELNKLKDMDLSPLARFFKGLSDSTKTFQEEFGDALQTLGQSIKQTLGTAFNSLFHGDVKGFFHGLVSGFQDALAQMASALLTSQLTKLLASILGSLLGGLSGGFGGGGGFASNIGGGGSLTGGLGGGFFASGGILPAGQSGIFGENGPERFMSLPGGGTRVWSNPSTKAMGGGSTTHIWNINTPEAQSFMGKQSQIMIERKLSQTTARGRKVS